MRCAGITRTELARCAEVPGNPPNSDSREDRRNRRRLRSLRGFERYRDVSPSDLKRVEDGYLWSIPVPPQTGHCSNNWESPSMPTTLNPRPLSFFVTPSPRQVTQNPKARHKSAKLDGLPASLSLVRHS